MPLAAERQMEHIGETCPVADCVHDLVQVFNARINSVWRYDQYGLPPFSVPSVMRVGVG
jgi:hypothetical protein